jgi:predicted N-acetyltransferase YhbS
MTAQLQLPRTLGDGLVLRIIESDTDAEKVVAVNTEIHGSDVGAIVRHWLFEGHPTVVRGDWLFIEDEATDQAVATLNLIPMTWRYGGQSLPVAELGFVATLPDYRRRGLQRVLSDTFDQLALSRGYALAAIEGIPGFYGQFGYEYALPLEGGFDLEFEQVPGEPAPTGYTIRPATAADVPALQKLYDASIAALDIAAPRDAALWTHQLSVPEEIAFYGTTTAIEREGRVVGYLRWGGDEWSDRLRVLELAVDDGPGARERILAALRFARAQGQSGDKSGLKLRLPAGHPAVILARYLGAVDGGHYGWQMKVLGPVGFMQTVGPVLEARLAGSLLAGYSGTFVFNLYRSRLVLRFEAGKLVEVDAPTGESHEVQADARMTLKQATQFWLGWRGREALEEWYPDFWSRDGARHLLDVLFPETRAYIYTPY